MGTLQAFVRSLPLPDELGGKRRPVNRAAPALIAAYARCTQRPVGRRATYLEHPARRARFRTRARSLKTRGNIDSLTRRPDGSVRFLAGSELDELTPTQQILSAANDRKNLGSALEFDIREVDLAHERRAIIAKDPHRQMCHR
jgi:hypothetical protein